MDCLKMDLNCSIVDINKDLIFGFRPQSSFTLLEFTKFAPDFKYLLIIIPPLLVLWYYFFWKTLDYYRDYTEFGYDDAKRINGSDASRRHAINEMRNQRKVGDIPPVYPNGWFNILESRDLPAQGAKEVCCLGLNLVVWRGESGKSYVADAYCPHLGAHLGVGGVVKGDCIECPFHKWVFQGGSGDCVHVPYSDSVPEFAHLKMWETLELNGFIYLWYHAEGEKPSWKPDEIPQVSSGEWIYRGRSVFITACHIQDVGENGADMTHFNAVHKPSVFAGGNIAGLKSAWEFISHIWSGSWEPNPDPKLGHKAIMSLNHRVKLLNRFTLMDVPFANVAANHVGPGMVYLHYKGFGGNGVFFFMTTPLAPLVMKLTLTFYSSRFLLHPIALLFMKGQASQLERDIAIWNRKTYLSRPILMKEDKAVKTFRRWFNQFYSENSPRLQNQSVVPDGRIGVKTELNW